jgi:hypothetical protein
VIWFKLEDGREEAIAYASMDITILRFGKDASYQNTAEYIAALMGAHGMTLMGLGGEPVMHRGDSVSALTWTQKGTVRSDVAIHAALVWGMYITANDTDVVATVHISHAQNSRPDILSRGGRWSEVLREDKRNHGGTLKKDVPRLDLGGLDLIKLCDPRRSIDSDEEFADFFFETKSFFA